MLLWPLWWVLKMGDEDAFCTTEPWARVWGRVTGEGLSTGFWYQRHVLLRTCCLTHTGLSSLIFKEGLTMVPRLMGHSSQGTITLQQIGVYILAKTIKDLKQVGAQNVMMKQPVTSLSSLTDYRLPVAKSRSHVPSTF